MTTREEKARRMAIRKETGNRPRVSEQSMSNSGQLPKYRAPDYLIAHACFDCQKSFKYKVDDGNEPVCPQCGAGLAQMGRAFKAPKKTDVSQWRKVKKLWDAGYRFPTNRYETVEYPRTYKEVDAFIESNPRHHCRLRSYWT